MEKQRNFSKLIRGIAAEEGLSLLSLSDDWAFILEKDGKRLPVVAHQFPLNPASVSELCRDKALTYEVLEKAGIPAVPHIFLPNSAYQAYAGGSSTEDQALQFLEIEREIVLKDNYGTGGSRVYYAADEEALAAALAELLPKTTALSLSPYVRILDEYRAVVLENAVRLVFSKERAYLIADGVRPLVALLSDAGIDVGRFLSHSGPYAAYRDPEALHTVPGKGTRIPLNWKHNLGQGASAVLLEEGETKEAVRALALSASAALGTRFSSVDVIRDENGLRVLEVNAGVMMEHFAGQGPEFYRMAEEIYRDALRLSFGSL